MEKVYKNGHSLANAGDLRKHAEDRLRKELSITNVWQQHDVVQKLYEFRINQIEIELLSEKFHKFRRNISGENNSFQEQCTSGDSYYFLDKEGNICDTKLVEFPSEYSGGTECRGRSLIKCISNDERAKFHLLLQEAFNSDVKQSCEFSFEHAGSKRFLDLILPKYALISAIVDDDKCFCLVVIKDISTRKIAEKREKDSKAALDMLEKTIAASRNEIFMFDAQHLHFTFANQRALENLGYTMEELRCLRPVDIQSQVFNQEMNDVIAYLMEHKNAVRKHNSVHLRKNGSMYPVEIYLQLFEQEGNSNFIAIILDISNQAAIESKLKSIVASAGAIIWAADADLKLSFMSHQILDILGYSADQFVGHSLIELLDTGFFHASDKAALAEAFNQVLKEGRNVSDLRYRANHADGTWRWLSMNMTPNRSVDGHIGQMVGVMHDISAQKLAEDELLQLNLDLDLRVREEIKKNMDKDMQLQRQSRLAGMGEMIGNIAHQWRQPINSLALILTDLEDAALYGEFDQQYLKTAVDKSKRIIEKMSTTIDDFRNFFRVDKKPGIFSLKKVTDECVNLVDAAMKSSNINIAIKCEHDVEVIGYSNEYSQAMMNILSNARDAIVENNTADGEIFIEICEEGEYGVHAVTDNGGGIHPEILPKIFEPHFTTKEQGIGIGLYMTLITVEKNMNGKIHAENVANGAKFTVYLPRPGTGAKHVIH